MPVTYKGTDGRIARNYKASVFAVLTRKPKNDIESRAIESSKDGDATQATTAWRANVNCYQSVAMLCDSVCLYEEYVSRKFCVKQFNTAIIMKGVCL
ncbi:hypothetical protein EVAR_59695_1 [Eumeta japonica]|uniref:Uncharacterized protein n=1 Tax=Eumeta variegata TaxID=151549 RepID=A0A4C1ZFU1_EUMVA|nr:hypothetical protein EVAR_59695_1 [Eumeta japonica]